MAGWLPLFAPGASSFAWQNVNIGGGGYQRGMDMHADGSMVSKTDVHGGYLGNTALGTVWKQLVTASSMPANYSESGTTNRFPVASGAGATCIKFAPSNSNVIYMIYDGYVPAVLVSQDKGVTWTDCAFTGTLPSQANGSFADYVSGQIVIDPGDPNIVYVGTPTGLLKTTNGLSGNSATWSLVNNAVFGLTSNPGVLAMCIDPTSGTTGGATNRVIVGVTGKGIYVTANGGSLWSLVASSTLNPGQGKMGVDGTYYVTDIGGTGIGRVTTGNVYANIGPAEFVHSVACDPVNSSRLVAMVADGSFNIPLAAVNSGTPTWAGSWHNLGLHAGAGQPAWIENSNDASNSLTPGDIFFDPFTTTSASAATPGNGSFTFTVAAGLPLAVGDGVRVYETANKANFIEGFVTAYSGTSLTIASTTASASNAVAVGIGSKSFTVASGLAFAVGSPIMMYSAGNNNNNMTGTVTSYSGTNLVVNVTSANGSSSWSDWVVNHGAQGGSGSHSDWTIMKNRIWFSYGCGVLYTDYPIAPGRQTYNVQTTGIENMVTNQISWPPGGDPIAAFWDRPIWNLANPATPQANYWPYNTPGSSNVIFGSSVDYAKDDPTFCVAVYNFDHGGGYSTNKGLNGSWSHFAAALPGSAGAGGGGGTIAALTTNKFVVARNNPGAGIFQTQNRGATWTAVSGAPSGGWSAGSALIGARRIICADEVTAGVVYAYNNDVAGGNNGLWISTDGGISMSKVYAGSLSPSDDYETQLRAVPGQAGHLFYTRGITTGLTGHPDTSSNPLKRTTNAQAGAGVVAWSTVSNVAEVLCIGFGKAQSGGYPAVYIFGWVNQGSGYHLGVWRSDDNCVSWNNIATWPPRTDISGAGGWLDQPRTLTGNPNRWNSCIIGCPGSSVSYYGPVGSY